MRLRRELAVAVLLYGGSALVAVGTILGVAQPNSPAPPGAGAEAWADPHALFGLILGKNLLVYGLLLLGLLTGGSLSAAVLLYNGGMIGTLAMLALAAGHSLGTVALLVLPHGALESAGLCLGGSVGLAGWAGARRLLHQGRFGYGRDLAVQAGVGAALLLLAAFVEVTLTRAVALSLLGA